MRSFCLIFCAVLLSATLFVSSAFADVTKTVGTGGNYATLKLAFDAINAGTIKTGVITLQIISSITDNNSASLNASGVGSASYTSVVIYPTGTGRILSGAVNGALINLNGADNVTIDGAVNGSGTTKSMNISNTYSTSAANVSTVQFANGATYNTLKNCILKGANGNTASAVVFLAGTVNNDNNVIQNNDITKGTIAPANGVLNNANGQTNNNNQIKENNIYDFSSNAVLITGNSVSNIYSGNKIYQSASFTGSLNGFTLNAGGISGDQFTGNLIYNMNVSGTVRGFYLQVYSSTPCLIANNMINLTNTNSSTIYGIHDSYSSTKSYNLYYNTILIRGSNGSSYCYYKTNSPVVEIKNNIFINQRTTGTHYVLYYTLSNNTGLTSNYNDFYKSSGDFGYYGGIKTAFSDFNYATTKDAQSINEMPTFQSTTSELRNSTSAISGVSANGTPVSVTTDFYGNSRDANFPDIGADEYEADYYEFLGRESNDWGTAANWNKNAVPTSSNRVVVPRNKTLDVSSTALAECDILQALQYSVINVLSGKKLTVHTSFVNNGTLKLLDGAQDHSSLIFPSSGVSAFVDRGMQHGRWELIASPVSGQNLTNFAAAPNSIASGGGYRAFRDYNEMTNTWNNFFTDADMDNYGSLNLGQGYSMRRVSDLTAGADSTNNKITFSGTIETGPVDVPITKNGPGWNCLGNPYSSAVALNDNAGPVNFISTNINVIHPSYGSVYVWKEADQTNYRAISNASNETYIPLGAAFFVKSVVGGGTISFTPDMRVHQSDVTFRSASTTWTGFDLNATSTAGKLYTSIKLSSKMTDGLDVSYDAGFMPMSNSYGLYTKLINDNGVNFAIQCVTDTIADRKIIPVGLDCTAGGEITFSASGLTLPDGISATLEDRSKGVFTTLDSPTSSYKVTVPVNTTGTGRFYVHLKNNTVATPVASLFEGLKISVSANTEGVNVYGVVGNGAKATLYDAKGMRIGEYMLSNAAENHISLPSLSAGFYILSIQTEKGKVVKKFNL